MKYRKIYFALSAAIIIPGAIALALWGLKPSVDFTGGAQLTLEIRNSKSLPDRQAGKIRNEELQAIAQEHAEDVTVQAEGENQYTIRAKPISEEGKNNILRDLRNLRDQTQLTELRFESVGPTLGRELLVKTITAVALAAAAIFLYVAWRFKDRMYGVSAILAMFHDSFIIIGSFAVLGHFLGVEVDTLFVTAVLTTLSFSVHDTIVVYDRIRETLKKEPRLEFVEVANRAVNETLARSIYNSLTIIFMLLALAVLGGETIRWFVVALLIGTIAGTYSSTFTATPLVVVWNNFFREKER